MIVSVESRFQTNKHSHTHTQHVVHDDTQKLNALKASLISLKNCKYEIMVWFNNCFCDVEFCSKLSKISPTQKAGIEYVSCVKNIIIKNITIFYELRIKSIASGSKSPYLDELFTRLKWFFPATILILYVINVVMKIPINWTYTAIVVKLWWFVYWMSNIFNLRTMLLFKSEYTIFCINLICRTKKCIFSPKKESFQ